MNNTKSFKDGKKENIFGSILQKSSQSVLMLDVSDIHILKTIAETGSINRAAEQLFMSQPTLSKRITRLEHILKVELFHRHSTGMKPTSITNYLISNGKQIQSQLDAMCRHVELLSNLEGGSLNVGASPIVEQLFFPKVLLDFVEETHNVKISFNVDTPEKLEKAVLDGEIDIGIGPFDVDELSQDLIVTEIDSGPLEFVVRPEHPLLDMDSPVSYEQLTQYPGIGPLPNKTMEKFLTDVGYQDILQITCDNYRISKSVVTMSDYFTGGPLPLFQKGIAKGELYIVDVQPKIPWRAYYVTRPESIYTPTVKKFLEVLEQYSDLKQ